jgi:pilus assembly protein Flp/PilA
LVLTFEFAAAWLRSRVRSERGASLVEYALLLALVAVVCIVAITSLGRKASSNFSMLSSQIN